MQKERTGAGRAGNFSYETWLYNGQFLHRIQVMGPVSLKDRIELYHSILALNASDSLYCIMDNSKDFENSLSFEDMKVLDRILVDSGIATFFGVTVTLDAGYASLVKLAEINAALQGLNIRLYATSSVEEAEKLVFSQLD